MSNRSENPFNFEEATMKRAEDEDCRITGAFRLIRGMLEEEAGENNLNASSLLGNLFSHRNEDGKWFVGRELKWRTTWREPGTVLAAEAGVRIIYPRGRNMLEEDDVVQLRVYSRAQDFGGHKDKIKYYGEGMVGHPRRIVSDPVLQRDLQGYIKDSLPMALIDRDNAFDDLISHAWGQWMKEAGRGVFPPEND